MGNIIISVGNVTYLLFSSLMDFSSFVSRRFRKRKGISLDKIVTSLPTISLSFFDLNSSCPLSKYKTVYNVCNVTTVILC